MMDEDFEYDVIILCSLKDRHIAEDLEYLLDTDGGLSVWFNYYDEDAPEESVRREIEHHLDVSKVLVFLMSPNAFTASEWAVLEGYTTLFRDPSDADRHFVPVLIEETEIPEVFRQYNYIDWQKKGNRRRKKGYEELLQVCTNFTRREDSLEEDGKPEIIPPQNVFQGHGREISKIETACEGQVIISAALDNKIKIWKAGNKYSTASLSGHSDYIYGLAVTPDGKTIVSGSDDRTVRVWDALGEQCKAKLTGHKAWVRAVAVTPDGMRAVSGSDDRTVRVWDTLSGECIHVFQGEHRNWVRSVAISEDGNQIVSGSIDGVVCYRDLLSGKYVSNDSEYIGKVRDVGFLSSDKLLLKDDHSFSIWDVLKNEFISYQGKLSKLNESVVMHVPDKNYIVFTTGFEIQLMDLERDRVLLVLEGHTAPVGEALITPDGKVIVSTSQDRTMRVWDVETGDCLKVVDMPTQSIATARMTGNDLLIIIYGSEKIGVWKLDDIYNSASKRNKEVLYTNAKVLLVGETGTGKSGLAHRLVNDEFVQTFSTDGVWASQMKLPYDADIRGTERELWLWDFAGQSDYRLIHQLYMDETALAVLVFNPQQENPFEGLAQWDRDIQRASRRPFKKLLIAGRTDRGGLMVSRKSIEDFCRERNFAEYLETSALTGKNCRELRDAIIKNINWEDVPYISSPRIFKLLKEQIIRLKDEGRALMRLAEIKQQLEMRLPEEIFTIDELKAVIGLLASPGVIKELEFGGFILLQPQLINSYASAVVRSVRAHIDEIGCISEDRVLTGDLDYQDLQRLPQAEEEIVLRAMHQMLVARGICLREPSEGEFFSSYHPCLSANDPRSANTRHLL
jgi:small GTP-binding protein